MVPDELAPPQTTGPQRRVFVVLRDVPKLQRDVLAGEPHALRRVLGARRSGRLGAIMLLAAFLAAVRPGDMSLVATVYVLTSAVLGHLTARPLGLGPIRHQRLLCWFVAPLIWLTTPLRWVLTATWIPATLALIAGQLLLAKYLLEPRPFGELATDPVSKSADPNAEPKRGGEGASTGA